MTPAPRTPAFPSRAGGVISGLLVFIVIVGAIVAGYWWFNDGASEKAYQNVNVRSPVQESILPDRDRWQWSPDGGLQQPSTTSSGTSSPADTSASDTLRTNGR
ncbi:MAG: hypothetical protein H0V44_17140 [Planctomycetes bacterium]|nr:hypothetical protein [Planctomycetota bacterium]